MEGHGLDVIDHCSFETQYAKWMKYPTLFVGSLQVGYLKLEALICIENWTSHSIKNSTMKI